MSASSRVARGSTRMPWRSPSRPRALGVALGAVAAVAVGAVSTLTPVATANSEPVYFGADQAAIDAWLASPTDITVYTDQDLESWLVTSLTADPRHDLAEWVTATLQQGEVRIGQPDAAQTLQFPDYGTGPRIFTVTPDMWTVATVSESLRPALQSGVAVAATQQSFQFPTGNASSAEYEESLTGTAAEDSLQCLLDGTCDATLASSFKVPTDPQFVEPIDLTGATVTAPDGSVIPVGDGFAVSTDSAAVVAQAMNKGSKVPQKGESVVSLGDSYASGTGSGGPYTPDNCAKSTNAYGAQWAARNSAAGFTFHDDSCSGAQTSHVRENQLTNLTAQTKRVTLTVGGNDINFGAIIANCRLGDDLVDLVNPGIGSVVNLCRDANSSGRDAARSVLPERMAQLLADIRGRSPHALIVVTGYPRPYGDGAAAATHCGLGALPRDLRLDVNDTIGVLNSSLNATVAATGDARIKFADVDPAFEGHRLCDGVEGSDQVWLTGLSAITDPDAPGGLGSIKGVYHPTQRGHADGYLPAVSAF